MPTIEMKPAIEAVVREVIKPLEETIQQLQMDLNALRQKVEVLERNQPKVVQF